MPKSISSPILAGAAALALLPLFASSGAQAVPFSFTASGGCSEACSASATITPGAGTLTVVLIDTQANPRSAGDLLSSIEITPSGALGAPTLASQNGSLIDVTPGAATGTPVAGNPTHWGGGHFREPNSAGNCWPLRGGRKANKYDYRDCPVYQTRMLRSETLTPISTKQALSSSTTQLSRPARQSRASFSISARDRTLL